MDFLAIASMGTYPTPTPTDALRAGYAVTFGLLGTMPEGITGYSGGMFMFMDMVM